MKALSDMLRISRPSILLLLTVFSRMPGPIPQSETVPRSAVRSGGELCGLEADSRVHVPTDYGRLSMPKVGESNAIVDDQYGCPIWKIADMSVHDAGPSAIDSKDRWIVTKGATSGSKPNWFDKSGMFVRDLHTGAVVCTPSISGAGGWIWGAQDKVLDQRTKWNDLDTLYYHVTGTNQIWRLYVPGCIAAGDVANAEDARVVRKWDDLTGKNGFTGRNLTWCGDASDFPLDGDHLCTSYNDGGNLKDARLYTLSTKTVGPALTQSPHQPPGCSPAPSKGNCYRGAFIGPASDNIVLAYQIAGGLAYLDLFDGSTGKYLRTLTSYNSHGSLATWNGEDYAVNDVNGLDPQRPPDCSPGIQAIKLSDASRNCLLNKATTGTHGSAEYQEPHGNGRGTDGGNAYIAFDVIDYLYNYSAQYVFAKLPNPGSGTVLLTDATREGDCSSGGGSKKAFCRWNGTYKRWDPVSTASYPLRQDWASNWGLYYNEIYLLFLDGTAPRHLVHHRSFSVEPLFGGPGTTGYWSSPRVVVSRSGKYIAWDSTWGANNNISVYVSRIKQRVKPDHN